ncbi:hypothetical protein HPB47_024191 [Ixodes persulcatus]|uniref:Uncharacterized protein n=1 Tax=Ixodes persulcatus TaxID=34615 RepID=A0AC60Q522_IXOPE|nr:hypothetical protein HPB47_024191 [Ixodes persulcatus]
MADPRASDSAARRRGVGERGFLWSLSQSQAPGLKVVCDSSQPRLRRACWLAILIVFLLLTLRDIYRTAEDFLRRPVGMGVEVSNLRQGSLPLPAITVCNINQVRKSVLCGDRAIWGDRAEVDDWRDKLCGTQIRDVWISYDDDLKCITGVVQASMRNKSYAVELTQDQLSEATNFSEWVMETQRMNQTLGKLMGHQGEDLIRECSLGARSSCKEPGFFYQIPYGPCGTCYCYNFMAAYSLAPGQTDNPNDGLRLILDAEVDEYLPVSTEVGFKVMIHDPGVEADYSRNGVYVPPGFATYLRISKTTLERLEPPYPDACQHDWPPGYKENFFRVSHYSLEKCLSLCHQLEIVRECSCMAGVVRTFNLHHNQLCKSNESRACVQRVNLKVSLKQVSCPCLKPCYEATYKKLLTQRAWKRTSALVTSVGGTMGMYLGFSFVLIFSVVEALTRGFARVLGNLRATCLPRAHTR